MAEKKKVVVVGGGVAGSTIAKGLEDSADVVVIDPKNYFEIPYPEPRSIVQPSFADRTLLLYEEFLKKAKVVQSLAEDVTAKEVITASGISVPYDYLVITTGTTFEGAASKAERLQQFKEKSVLVIGGGPVGVELAAEIITDFPQKKVTLVQGGERVLGFLGPKAAQKTEDWFQKKGVQVILNDHVEISHNLTPPSYVTKKNVPIKADAHFVAVGKRIGSEWLTVSQFLKDALAEDGHVKMKPTTQVVGFNNVFAAGDITDFKEIKQGYLAAKHADIVIRNIKKLLKNPRDERLEVYKPLEKSFGVVTLGRFEAVAQIPFVTLLGWIPGKLKS